MIPSWIRHLLLDETMKAVTVNGAIMQANVGSTAVLNAIKNTSH